MGLFSKKRSTEPKVPPQVAELPKPGPVSDAKLEEARQFMADWVNIVGQASDPVFWGALERFGRIGDAVQAQNTHSDNIRMFRVAEQRFNNDFEAMFNWPWQNWLAIAKKANDVGDFELAAQIFFFAWTITNQVTFDINVSGVCGFLKPSTEVFHAIAGEARTAAINAPEDFEVVERAIEAPVSRSAILMGTGQLLGNAPGE